ncbi:AAC(3) family N-acetyltransferase [Vibrio splendidus]
MSIEKELAQSWKNSGIANGDTVLLHSNIKNTYKKYLKIGVKITPEIILNSFLEAIGPEGTILFPLFNFDFCNGVEFDIHNTKSSMGALTEAGRKYPGAVRTGHPVYSFSVIGKNKHLFSGVCNYSAYGEDSPFAILHKEKAKIAVLGLSENSSMTFYHYVEEACLVDYRYHKEFVGSYIDAEGIKKERGFNIFVRDLNGGIETDVEPCGNLMWEKGLYSGNRFNQGNGLRVISAALLFEEARSIIERNEAQGLLYRVK